MGLLQLLPTVVVALIVFIDGIASTTNEISATESSVLQNKVPTSAGAPPTRELVGDEEERAKKSARVRGRAYLYPSEFMKTGYGKFIGWLRRVFHIKSN
ncbi:hypothetical protein PR001_g881 [Phytophthora rubi]|uniref:RxLR effector protein n=1 Tax=Phytophthora rubi TaxID=129364 RepID=A0A6A3LFK8_9STRA|nr:hypothetical protein PR002_g13175 [Phytophthora rubi]KAE9052061.1 hypothetical protein PR001_g881 [Phytophthora rubi]